MQRAATQALGEREGTILVLNPHDGRIRTVINPRLAFEQTFPPGSTIKPFTALVAMRSGLANDDTRVQCEREFKHENYRVTCTHKRVNNSFKLHHAIAYSCNYYFSTLAERMNAASFLSTLDSFGFGARTGVNASEASGKLQPGDWQLSTAIGNDDKVLVTPIQLLMAFTTLINGGHLLRPRLAEANNFQRQATRSLNLNSAQRSVLLEGMQGCTLYGSAADAGLDKLPYDVIGKTGTSGASNGFRTQGWFVSFLLHRKNAKTVEPNDLNIAVLVFLKRAHGAEAASVAADFYRHLIFGKQRRDDAATERSGEDPQSAIRNPQSIRVRLVRENQTVEVALEDYIRGVLAAEASVETELEGLKAQSVVSRTFARKNLQRHKAEGYDFCSLTHCQRYVNQLAEHNKALLMRAADETAGQVLQDERGHVADVYFHAACGGMTTNIEAVWGAPSPSYLRSVKDDYCTTMSHKSWTQSIPARDLLRALQTEERSNVGAQLTAILVTKRDTSGRAEFITLEGARRRQLRGWDFALIVNRVLGWNMLKSSRFAVQRVGSNFLFRGSGFGHGLGLCQEGAHVMARRGMGYQQIVAHYLPGAKLSQAEASARIVKAGFGLQVAGFREQRQRATQANEHFRLSYGKETGQAEVVFVLQTLEAARADLLARGPAASMSWASNSLIQVRLHSSTGDYVAATGQPAWTAAATRGNTMQLQPLALLRKRGILTTTLRHELAHVALESLGNRRAPRWLVEGLAIHFAGEGRMYPKPALSLSLETLEKRLAAPPSAQEMKQLYALAYAEVRRLIQAKGEAKVWQNATNL